MNVNLDTLNPLINELANTQDSTAVTGNKLQLQGSPKLGCQARKLSRVCAHGSRNNVGRVDGQLLGPLLTLRQVLRGHRSCNAHQVSLQWLSALSGNSRLHVPIILYFTYVHRIISKYLEFARLRHLHRQ